jgi:hypothetical protein
MVLPHITTETLDSWLERVLFVKPQHEGVADRRAPRVFGAALFVSATRCLVQYVLFPFVLPFVGVVGGVPVWLSLLFSGVALVSLVSSLRRFWHFKHPRRFAYLPLALLMFFVLTVFILSDLGVVGV